MALASLNFLFKSDTSNFNKGLKSSQKKLDGFSSGLKSLQGSIAAAFTAGALVGFTKQVISVRGEFEKYEAVLATSLGTQNAAATAMGKLSKFASETPFQLSELTAAYVKLVNLGFKPTETQMRQMGDVASATGKSFMQLTEAILDAATGEFERLKEFGIRA